MELNTLILTVTDYAGEAAEEPLTAAWKIARSAHEGFRRLSGEPYINHPLAVATILADWKAPVDVVAAGLLHDVLAQNYSHVNSLSAIEHDLKPDWRSLFESITKLNRFIRQFEGDFNREIGISLEGDLSREANVNILLHDTLSIIQNRDAFIIKIADRFHNLHTASFLDKERRQRTASIALNIFAPLAERLGMGQVKSQLEDECFRIILPAHYAHLEDYCTSSKFKLEVEDIAGDMNQRLAAAGVQCETRWQPFSLYTIYHHRMEEYARHGQLLSDGTSSLRLEDVGSFIFLPEDDIQGCYQLIGKLHTRYPAVDKQWHDYISHPLKNGYRSIHTQVTYTNGHHLNCVARTHLMDIVANYGYTAPWQAAPVLSVPDEYLPHIPLHDRPAKDEIVVYTPKGDEKFLPHDATTLDFAYEVHADLGDHYVGARINDRETSPYSTLRNEDKVEILTDEHVSPTPDWLHHVITHHAQNRIRHALALQHRSDMQQRGRNLLDEALQKKGLTLDSSEKLNILTHIALKEGLEEPDDVLVSVGVGRWTAEKLVEHIQGVRSTKYQTPTKQVKILEPKYATLPYAFAHCCKPEATDAITAHLRNTLSLLIHKSTCPNLLRAHAKDRVPVDWDISQPEPDYIIVIEALNRPSFISDMGKILQSLDIEQESLNEQKLQDGRHARAEISLGHTTKLQRDSIRKELSSLPSIKSVEIIHISEKKPPLALNPYTMNPAFGKHFFGREIEHDRFTSQLSENQNSTILLWGSHRIGKTSFLLHLEKQELSREAFFPVYIDLSGLDGCPNTTFLYTMMQSIHNQVKATLPGAAHNTALPPLSRFRANPLKGLETFLDGVHNKLNNRPLVVIMDELQYLPTLTEDKVKHVEIFQRLRSLTQHGNGVHFIFSSSGLADDLLEQSGLAQLLASSYNERLGYLGESAARDLITNGLTAVAEVDAEAVTLLFNITRGHPYYLQLLCYQLFNQLQDEQCEMTPEYTWQVINQWIQESNSCAFMHLLETSGANPQQRHTNTLILSAIAKLSLDNREVSFGTLSKALGNTIGEQDLTHALRELKTMGVLKNSPTYYAIDVELFALWLRQRRSFDHL